MVDGTCYEDAWRFLIKEEEGELIHGTVESLGKRIGHAWVELPTGFIWEPENRQFIKKADFQMAKPQEEARYSVTEAAIMLARVGKHGPWTKEEKEEFLKGGNPIPDEELDLARTLATIDSRPKGRIIESKLREEFGDAVIDALRQGRYVVSGSAGYDPPLLVSLKGRELIQGGNPVAKTETERKSFHERIFGKGSTPPLERLRRGETVNNLLPMLPEEGPPLPRMFALRWPWKK